jgi:hypothetical protein
MYTREGKTWFLHSIVYLFYDTRALYDVLLFV